MYDLYPYWGPAHLREDEPDAEAAGAPALTSVQEGLDLRDNGGQRPDDN